MENLQAQTTVKAQWQKAFVLRSFNVSDIVPFLNSRDVEVAVPMFLRARAKEIINIGKSVKLVRYLDPHHLKDCASK
jgi:hypothetical protein